MISPDLIKQHEYDELIFGGFLCLTCTPEAAYDEDPDLTVMWPCPTLRAAGMTDDEATAVITADRASQDAKRAAACIRCTTTAAVGTCCTSHDKKLCHLCYRRTHFVEVCVAGCPACAAEGLPVLLSDLTTQGVTA
ncbi:hypothetical protein ACH4T9_12375 [Micromonospora sp. NPDC020750]|uniref:hypothetical protein n=1 Tax=unclassified Micromonospora TaxID=2617518 RepID=UPI0037921B5F